VRKSIPSAGVASIAGQLDLAQHLAWCSAGSADAGRPRYGGGHTGARHRDAPTCALRPGDARGMRTGRFWRKSMERSGRSIVRSANSEALQEQTVEMGAPLLGRPRECDAPSAACQPIEVARVIEDVDARMEEGTHDRAKSQSQP